MLIRSDMSGMRVLSGLRAAVETCPMWWAFPTSESYARYDSPTAYGGLSLSQYSSTCLARGLPQCGGSSIVPCPGFPFRASEAVDHTRAFATAGTSGASHVLRRLSSCMPRPEDSGGPALPRPCGDARVAFGSVQTLGVRKAFSKLYQHFRVRGHPCGLQDTLSTLRPSCSPRIPPRLHHGRKTRYGWVASPYPTGTFTLQETPSFSWREDAGRQARLKAGARHERTLFAVAWTPWFGWLRGCAAGQPEGTWSQSVLSSVPMAVGGRDR